MQAARPENENQRLQALYRYQILDTPPESIFDELTQLASDLCETPIALISLLDAERQWFKSKVGLNLTETSRELAFCRYTILQEDLLIVGDTTQDERFATNPLVVANPHTRFYAGAPLVTADGYALGSLCVIDVRPRTINREQQNILRKLAQRVVKQLENRQRQLGQPCSTSFPWGCDQNSHPLWVVDDETLQFLAVNQIAITHYGYSHEEFLAMRMTDIHAAGDRANLVQRLTQLQHSASTLTGVWQHRCKDGRVIDVATTSYPLQFAERRAMLVVVEDISQGQPMETTLCGSDTRYHQAEMTLRQQGELLETIVDHMPVMLALFDRQGKLQWTNREWQQVLGWTVEEIQNRDVLAEFYPDLEYRRSVIDFIQRADRVWQDFRIQLRDGSVLDTAWANIRLSDGSTIGIGQDITDRKQTERALQQQIEREHLVAGITQRIRQSLNLVDILTTTVAEVRQFLQTDRVFIYRFHADWGGTVDVESVAYPWMAIAGTKNDVPLDDALIEQLQQGQMQVVEKLGPMPTGSHYLDLLKRLHVKAFLIAPILHGDHLWGALVVHQCLQPRPWQQWEISLLQQLANQTAIAIQQADLYQQVKRFNVDLEHQVQERTYQLERALDFDELLKRITDKVRDSLDEDQILQTAVRELALGLATEGCDTGLYDASYTTCTICHECVVSMVPAKGLVISVADHIEVHRQLLAGHYLQFCWLAAAPRAIEKQFAVLACPIFDDQGVLGTLCLFKHREEQFNELELRLVQLVATQCAIAIRQARLYQMTQAQVESLEKLNQLKDEFLSTVSHELRTPISNMSMAIHMLKLIPNPERRQYYLDILETECKRETHLINDLLDLQRLEANRYTLILETINLQDWLPSVIAPFLTRTQEHQQQLHVDYPSDLPALRSDRSSLERILGELLNNACKYTPPQGEIVFGVRVTPIAEITDAVLFHFSVRNTATIPPAELPRIFDKFYRIPHADPWKQGGTGLGLALVKKLVEQLQGTLKIDSNNGWTTFTISLQSVDE